VGADHITAKHNTGAAAAASGGGGGTSRADDEEDDDGELDEVLDDAELVELDDGDDGLALVPLVVPFFDGVDGGPLTFVDLRMSALAVGFAPFNVDGPRPFGVDGPGPFGVDGGLSVAVPLSLTFVDLRTPASPRPFCLSSLPSSRSFFISAFTKPVAAAAAAMNTLHRSACFRQEMASVSLSIGEGILARHRHVMTPA
jgi:hypothetical protein